MYIFSKRRPTKEFLEKQPTIAQYLWNILQDCWKNIIAEGLRFENIYIK